ncbi:probable cytochrome P450 CYP44 [Liolophura sinensis]|uniref:probable cytochrome P450 CYP44 n=1 Tax=Liolophura sinensis TaxID=3198878 RepID=UPI003158E4D5
MPVSIPARKSLCSVAGKLNGFVSYRAYLVHGARWQRTASASDSTERKTNPCGDFQSALPFESIPGPKGLPYFGTLLQYKAGRLKVANLHNVFLDYYKRYGKIVKDTVAGQTVIHIFDPDYVKDYFQQEDKLPDVPPLLDVTKQYRNDRKQSPGLGNSLGKEWYRLRSGVQKAMLAPTEVVRYFPKVNSVAEEFLQKLLKIRDGCGQVPHLRNEIARWSIESAWITAFDTHFGCIANKDHTEAQAIIDANALIFRLSVDMKFSVPWYKIFPTPKRRRIYAAEDYILSIVQKHVDQTVEKIKVLQDKGELLDGQYSFLTYLLSREQLTYTDIVILTLSLPFDGVSTNARMLYFNMYCIAKNPDVQKKLYNEIEQHLPGDEPLTPEKLSKLSYLKACVKETFRFFPIGLEISRILKKDMVIGGYQLPAGTQLEMNNFVMAMLPEYFVSPERYLPERWIKDTSTQNIHPFIMIPFGHGPRMCVGRRFAEQELYTMLTKLFKTFHIEWTGADLDKSYRILTEPSRPSQFIFTERNPK